MNKYLNGFEVIRRQGGMEAFKESGIYPDFMIFYSTYYDYTWTEQFTSETQEGPLSMNGRILYEYKLSGDKCTIRAVIDGISVSDVVEVQVNDLMMD